MSVDKNNILKLRPSVAVVIKPEITEFFLTNLRKSITLGMNQAVSELLFQFNGKITIFDWILKNNIPETDLSSCLNLLDYLIKNHILIIVDEDYDKNYEIFPRVFTLLEDYSTSQAEVTKRFTKLYNSHVMIVGLGSVGTWVAQCMIMDGVKNLTIVDKDKVELSNLHRQTGFTLQSINKSKVECLAQHLHEIKEDVNIHCIEDNLDKDFFYRNEFSGLDLIINCADHPSVDDTSKIIGEYAMRKGIKHIIGGGYNLHQSLIGQVVIPGETACLECFRMNLDELNEIDTSNITKLNKEDRKIGSFPPLSVLSASITANEAFKVLAGIEEALVMVNSRTEFLLRSLNYGSVKMNRRNDCKWCGKNGKYYHI